MAEKLIFAEQSIEGFDSATAYISPAYIELVTDQTYRVVWDGEEYVCNSFTFQFEEGPGVIVGNPGALGLEDNGLPFDIVYATSDGESANQIVCNDYESTSHTVAIYQIIVEDPDYLIKGSTLTAIANSIRAKTGTTDPIKVADMATTIGGITGGGSGGSSADVRYVTFMSHDGTIEYGKLPVAVGYDCPTPKFDTPKRESDVQYNYTFAGWATTANGGLDGNALKAVTEDRTLYANYISTLRKYTITYYDSDGTTVLKTEPLVYGSTPSYKPQKDGFVFAGWEPALSEVTGDASYSATWSEKLTFADATWADIVKLAQDGTASAMFTVGDTKDLVLNYADGTTETVTCTLIGMNDTTGKFTMEDGNPCNMAIMTTQPLKDDVEFAPYVANGFHQKQCQSQYFTAAKYLASNGITHLNSVVLPALPAALQENMRKRSINASDHFSVTVNVSATLLPPKYSDLDWDSDYTNNISSMYKRGETTASAYWLATFAGSAVAGKYTHSAEFIRQNGSELNTSSWINNKEDDADAKGVVFVICI